ncbi:MAG: DUF4347 domain-containing protein [Burkholderiales bacterium]
MPLPAGDVAALRHELVFVDASLTGLRPRLDALVAADRTRAIDVVILDSTRDGIDQIDDALTVRKDIDAVHVLGHGEAGVLQVGDTLLTTAEATRRAAVLGRWHQILRPGADLLLYGCDVAGNVDGIRLMETLGALTGMDVAASDDATGAAELGGDWLLERTLGDVTAAGLSFDGAAAWSGTLALGASDSFVSSGKLNGASGGTGWAGAWSADNGKLKANGSGLSDPDGLMSVNGGSVRNIMSGALATTTATRDLASTVGAEGTTTWLGFLVQPHATSLLGDYMGIEFGSSSADIGFAGYNGTSFVLERAGGSGRVTVSGITPTAGQTYFIALKIESAAGNDTVTMYVDPTPGASTPDSSYTAVKSNLDLGTFTRIGIATGQGLSSNRAELDELRVGDSYLDVAPGLVVTTTADINASGIVDGNASQDIAWLNAHRGTDISLREAIIAANNTAGANAITFNIAAALVSGKHTITLASALPTVSGAVLLDGTTEPDYAGTPVIVINGGSLSGSPAGLALTADGNTIQGIVIESFGGAGITVSSAAGAAILGNLIYSTGKPGIDLGATGTVLANDAGDADGGASSGMNYPVIYSASLSGGTVTITGEARPGATVEFFEADTNSTDHGGATSFIGTGTVGATGTAGTTDATAVQFSFSFSAGTLGVGDELTATATASSAHTSEFAANAVVTEPNTAPVLDATKSPTLAPVAEDAGAPSGSVGTRVSALVDFASPGGQVDNVTDSNVSPSLGIAITAADTSRGSWWYTTDAGDHWYALGSPTTANARLLASDADTRLYFQPGADDNGTIPAAITFRAWDRTTGSNGGTADTTAHGGTTAFSATTDTAGITVTAVNDAPTLTTPAAQVVAEDGSTGALTITVADVDSAVGSLTLTATSGNTTLIPNANLVAGGSGSSRTLTVTPAANQNGGPVTITVSVSDGTATSSTTFSVTVTAVNDGPVNTVPATVIGHRDTAIVFSSAGNTVAITDVDAGTNPVQVSLSASNGSVLTLDGVTGLAFTTGDGTNDASLVFSGTVSDINAALGGMQLMPAAGYTGPTFLTITTLDLGSTGSGGAQNDVDTIAITITPNDTPVVTLPGAAATYTENGAGVVVDGGLTVSDGDDPDLASAVVWISGNHQADQDRLEFTDQLGITGAWNATSGVLTLTGTASLADYQTALRTITYRNISDAPIDSTRTISVAADDGFGSNVAVTQTVNIAAVNDAPAITVPIGQTTLEDTALVFTVASGNAIAIADPDAVAGGVRVTLSVASGTLTLAATSGLTFVSGANGAAAMIIDGTVSDIGAALEGLSFRPAADASGSVTLTVTVSDLGHSGSGGTLTDSDSVSITVTAVNDAPTGADRTIATAEDTAVVLSLSDFALTDASDSPADTLLGILVGTAPVAGSLTLSGTAVTGGQFISASDIASGALRFAPAANAGGVAYATLTFQVRDDGGTADGGDDTDPASHTLTFDVIAANDAPTATGITTVDTYTEDTVLDFTDIAVADVDSGTVEVVLTLSDTGAGTLSTATSGSTTSLFAAGIWRASGATAEVNALLAGLTFTPTADYASNFTLAVSVSDGVAAPVTASKPVHATAVNDVPTITVIADQTTTEDTPTATLAFTIGDVETSAGALAVTAASSDPALVASSGLVLGGSGSSRTLTVTPVTNANGGPVTLTISVSDGTATTTESFDLTIIGTDDPLALGTPTLGYVLNGTTTLTTADLPLVDPDGPAGPVSFTVRNVTNGSFESSAAPGTPITGFTAADLAAGLIRFVHTGGESPPAFEVSATDGVTTTAYVTAVVTRVPAASDVDALNVLASQNAAARTVAPPPADSAPATPPTGSAPPPERGETESAASGPRTVLEMPVPRTPPVRTSRSSARVEPSVEEVGASDPGTPPPKPTAQAPASHAANAGGSAAALVPAAPTPGTTGPTAPLLASGGLAARAVAGQGQDQRAVEVDSAALEMHQAVLKDTSLRQALDQVKQADDARVRAEQLVSGSSAAVAGSLSVGYVVWLLRGGVLLSSLLSSLPAWQVVDPLPVLSRQRRDAEDADEDPDDPLERLFSKAQALKRFGRHRGETTAGHRAPGDVDPTSAQATPPTEIPPF